MRALTSAALDLLERLQSGEQIPVVRFVALDTAVPQYMSTAGYPLEWDGETWQPVGLEVEAIEDGDEAAPGAVALRMPAVTSAQLALALVEPVDGCAVRIYDAIVDPDSMTVEHAELVWSGTASVPAIEDGDEAVMIIACEHRAVRAYRAKPSRYTHDEQQRLHAGDTGLDYDPAQDGAQVVWPAASYWRM